VNLASHVQAGALVLIAPHTSIVEVGKQRHPFLPVSLILSDRFESDRKITSVHMPVFIHHTYEDEIFPIAMARRLYALAPNPKHLDEAHGGHGDTPLAFWVELQRFLNASAGFRLREPRSR
jgi:hypothetical protein